MGDGYVQQPPVILADMHDPEPVVFMNNQYITTMKWQRQLVYFMYSFMSFIGC